MRPQRGRVIIRRGPIQVKSELPLPEERCDSLHPNRPILRVAKRWDQAARQPFGWTEILMIERRPPVVVRERVSRLTGSRIATALVFDRDFTPEERESFSRLAAEGKPEPSDFGIDGRMVRYECEAEEADRWRLAVEIYTVKACRPAEIQHASHDAGFRARAGFRKLHLG